ncbi:MAG: hypothetical protein Q9206_006333 [Seirophora lacunosa]
MSPDPALAGDHDRARHGAGESLVNGVLTEEGDETATMDGTRRTNQRQQQVFQPIRSCTSQDRDPSRRRSPTSRRQATTLQHTRSFGDGHGFACFSNDEGNAEKGPVADPDANKQDFEVRWNGDEDVGNPRAMSRLRKWMIVLIVSTSAACVKPIYVVSFTFFLIWLLPCALARNIQTMLVARFLDGLAGSAFLSVAGGTIGDMFSRSELQAPMMIYSASPFIGPPVGPIVAGFINYFTTWSVGHLSFASGPADRPRCRHRRWTFYVLLIWAAAELALIIVVVPETYHPVLLKRKAIALRRGSGDERWRASIEQLDISIMQTIVQSIYRPFLLLTLEPMCLNLCLYSAVLLGVLYLFFGAFEIVFEENHGFNLWQVGLTFAGLLVGIVFAVATDPIWHRNYVRLIRNRELDGGEKGGAEPEYRLPPAMAGGILVPLGLFWFGWTTFSSVHWIVPLIGSSKFGAGVSRIGLPMGDEPARLPDGGAGSLAASSEDGKSSLQSQSPDENGEADMAEMAEHGGNGNKASTPSQSSNGQAKSTANAKDPTRPRRKKARRACYACQRAHLTCGDERPCQRCIKRGLQDACHDGVRKKAKYLHDAPNEAIMPGMGLRGAVGNQMHYLANLGRTQQLPPDNSYQGPSANDVYVQQQAMPTAFPPYAAAGPQSTMGPPLTDGMMPSQPYSNQQSPISPHFSSGPSHQPSPMQSMASAMQHNHSSQANPGMMQGPFDGTVYEVNDAMQYSFDPSSFNFGNHYGALEFGMLGHMSSGAADTTPTEATTQLSQANSTNYTTPGTIASTGFGGSPTNAQSYFYPQGQNLAEWQNSAQSGLKPAHFDQEGHHQGVAASICTAKQEAPDAYSIGAGPNFTPPSDTSSTQGMGTGFDDGPTAPATYLGAGPHQNMQDRAAQQRHPQSRPPATNQFAPVLPARRARDASSVYESVKQPYSYTNGFHGLTAFLQRRFPPQKTLRIAKALASIRPSFISCTKTLNRDDLIFMEKCFQRTLWEYEDFINAYGTPTIVCRRTGEVAAVGKEFSILTGWKKDVLLGKEPNLNVNTGGDSSPLSTAASSRGYNTPRMPDAPKPDSDVARGQPVFLAELLDDDSAIAFYEDFARLAFGDSRGSVTTQCKLLKYRTKADLESQPTLDNDLQFKQQRQMNRNGGRSGDSGVYQLGDKDGKVECSYCWTVKRDVFDIPMLIVMNV